jgi:hypothetical protein
VVVRFLAPAGENGGTGGIDVDDARVLALHSFRTSRTPVIVPPVPKAETKTSTASVSSQLSTALREIRASRLTARALLLRNDTRSSGAGVELAPALPEARPPIRARTSEPAHFGDPTGAVSCGVGGWAVPLTFLATATEAVHHPCITSTAFGSLPRDRGSTRNRMVKPNPPARRLVGQRIRLRGLLRKPLQMQGFLFGCASPVHHDAREAASSGRHGSLRKALAYSTYTFVATHGTVRAHSVELRPWCSRLCAARPCPRRR